MTGELADRDLKRMARTGVRPLSVADGLAMFDAAVASGLPTVVAARVDTQAPPRRAAKSRGPSLAQRLATVPVAEHEAILLDLVRTNAALVLGHDSGERIEAAQAFQDLGFDSLTAVEFRNLVGNATGLNLPATLVFDYPNPAALTQYLRDQVSQTSTPSLLRELDRLDVLADAVDDADRGDVLRRLRSMVSKLEGRDGSGIVESASDDELFDLLGKDFGIS
jgi:acyl carrier protein